MPKATNQEKALAALLATSSISEAAKKAKLSETTLHRYLKDDEFKKGFRLARRSLVEASTAQIQSSTSEAVETLKRNLSCGTPSAEIRAATAILDFAHKGIEVQDVLERLEVLEENAES